MNNLIYDRTEEDLINLTKKAFYNYDDLNRIEEWCEYLAQKLNSYSYLVSITTKTDWTMFDFPTQNEIERIRTNINKLQQAYFSFTKIPKTLDNMTIEKANDVERILFEVNDVIEKMIAQFFYCRELYSGEGIG